MSSDNNHGDKPEGSPRRGVKRPAPESPQATSEDINSK